VLVRSTPVAMLLGIPTVDSSPPSPDPSREKWREEEKRAQGPSQSSSSPLVSDRPALARADPQHPAAEPTPSQHTPETAVTGASSKRSQDPRAGELLVALLPASRDYKNPRRRSQKTHTTTATNPSTSLFPLPRKHPISARERRRVREDSGRHWSRCWCKVEELSNRGRSASSPSSSASPTTLPRRRTLFTATPVSLWPVPRRRRRCAVRS
jgi:hypothetical protein